MNEKIYTIPVTDAFEQGGECPFCNMYNKLERDAVNFSLGPSYMEDDVRMETNDIGFCKHHYDMMYQEQNRLGLALMVHTHLQEVHKQMTRLGEKGVGSYKKSLLKGLQKKSPQDKSKIEAYMNKVTSSCYICNKIEFNFLRYIDTFFYLFTRESKFKKYMENGGGFCLHHFNMLLDEAQSKLTGADAQEFVLLLVKKELESLEEMIGDVDWFIKKFDYRYKDEPWKNAKDALPRALQKLSALYYEVNEKNGG